MRFAKALAWVGLGVLSVAGGAKADPVYNDFITLAQRTAGQTRDIQESHLTVTYTVTGTVGLLEIFSGPSHSAILDPSPGVDDLITNESAFDVKVNFNATDGTLLASASDGINVQGNLTFADAAVGVPDTANHVFYHSASVQQLGHGNHDIDLAFNTNDGVLANGSTIYMQLVGLTTIGSTYFSSQTQGTHQLVSAAGNATANVFAAPASVPLPSAAYGGGLLMLGMVSLGIRRRLNGARR